MPAICLTTYQTASFGMLLGVLLRTAGQWHGNFDALDQCDGWREKEKESKHLPSTVGKVKADLCRRISIVTGYGHHHDSGCRLQLGSFHMAHMMTTELKCIQVGHIDDKSPLMIVTVSATTAYGVACMIVGGPLGPAPPSQS